MKTPSLLCLASAAMLVGAACAQQGAGDAATPAAQPEHARHWEPAIPAPVPGCAVETTIHAAWRNGKAAFSGIGTPKGREVALDIVNKLKGEFGNVHAAFVFGGRGFDPPDAQQLAEVKKFVGALEEMGVVVKSEGHDQPPRKAMDEFGLWARDIRGRTYHDVKGADRLHSLDLTHPMVLELLHEKLRPAAEAGVKVYRSVDYVWPWAGGPVWGYSDAAKRRWVEDLSGTDGMLEVLDGAGGRRRVGFHEYFKSYFGYAMRPEDCGLASWQDYLPPALGEADTPQRRNRSRLFNALFHYEWTKFLNESVRPYDEIGMRAQPTLNPENINNGTDLYWMLKSSLTRGWCTEWLASPVVMVPVYYHARYYRNIAEKFGKEILHLGESGAAGNGFGTKPNYWDNMAGYLVNYVEAAASGAKVMNDQYWSAPFDAMKNGDDPYLRDMYTAFRSSWCGFMQSKNDKVVKPTASMLVIQNRSVMHRVSNFDNGGNGIASSIMAGNYLYDGAAFPMEDACRLDDYATIVHAVQESPAGFGKELEAWLAGAPGRTLVTFGDILNREAAPARNLAKEDAPFRPGRTFAPLPEIEAGDITNGVLAAATPELAAALGELNGKAVELPQPMSRVSGGMALVTLGDAPIISEFSVGGSRVIYLHTQPMGRTDDERRIQNALVAAAMATAGRKPFANAPEGHRVLVFDREGQSGKVAIVINVKASRDMLRDGVKYRCYQAMNPENKGTFALCDMEPSVAYACRNMLTGDVATIVADASGRLEIPFDGWNLVGFYVERKIASP